MVTVTDRPVNPKRPISGIVADARRLNVTRQHLYLVLNGKRHSPTLIKRYRRLQREKKHNA